MTDWLFETPTTMEGPAGQHRLFEFFKLDRGLTIVMQPSGTYKQIRYPCQDPDNWGKKECTPPLCSADGNCTETLLGFDPTETTIEDTIETIPTEETAAP